MSDAVIRANGLGKKYVIGHQERTDRHRTLRDAIGVTLKTFARSARDVVAGRQLVSGDAVEEFWALKDVSLDIKRGEVIGIIGRNGAGKSTLLKILSRVTEPSEGRVEIRGRVASLLEVGTGFHPELTGRENIYLNGAILGMTRAEIKRKFDEIVAFAEIDKFLDTPVKRYSSGMYVRLAFAVAAHLEPEILIVDEVLAVGDAAFQKKCLGKMGEVANEGRTVLFVSHNMAAVSRLCQSAVLMKEGKLQLRGTTNEALNEYAASVGGSSTPSTRSVHHDAGTIMVTIRAIVSNTDAATNKAQIGVTVSASIPDTLFDCAILISTSLGLRVAIVDLRQLHLLPRRISPDHSATFEILLPDLPLVEGMYSLGTYVRTLHFCGDINDLAPMELPTRTHATPYAPYHWNYRGIIEVTAQSASTRSDTMECGAPGLIAQRLRS